MGKNNRTGLFGNIAGAVSDKIVKRPEALAMIGSFNLVTALDESGIFSVNGIDLVLNDFSATDELISYLSSHRNAEYVLISDAALSGTDAMKRIITDIRGLFPDVVIAFFINYNRKDSEFKNWAYAHKVYGFFYSDEQGQFDFKQIVPELINIRNDMPLSSDEDIDERKRQLHEDQKLIDSKNAALQEREAGLNLMASEIAERERKIESMKSELELKVNTFSEARSSGADSAPSNENEISSLKMRIAAAEKSADDSKRDLSELTVQHEKEKEALAEHMRFEMEKYKREVEKGANAEKEAAISELNHKINELQHEKNDKLRKFHESRLSKPKFTDTVTIGVFSITGGAGATYTSVLIAEYFKGRGYYPAVIALDNKHDLSCVKGNAAYFTPNINEYKGTISDVYSVGFNMIIFDLGVVFAINCDGGPASYTGDDYYSENKYLVEELNRCKFKVALGFSGAWNVDKLFFFTDNPVFRDLSTCLFAIEGASRGLKHPPLVICERGDIPILNHISEWLDLPFDDDKPSTPIRGKFPKLNLKVGNRNDI